VGLTVVLGLALDKACLAWDLAYDHKLGDVRSYVQREKALMEATQTDVVVVVVLAALAAGNTRKAKAKQGALLSMDSSTSSLNVL
jgi:hypothetical protein